MYLFELAALSFACMWGKQMNTSFFASTINTSKIALVGHNVLLSIQHSDFYTSVFLYSNEKQLSHLIP